VAAGYVFVDGLSVGEVGEIVLRDRKSLANDGMFMVVVTVDKQTGNVIGQPEIIARTGWTTDELNSAIGAANGANPVALVVPCHRVIGSDGSLTGYGGGLDKKEHLLRLEGAIL